MIKNIRVWHMICVLCSVSMTAHLFAQEENGCNVFSVVAHHWHKYQEHKAAQKVTHIWRKLDSRYKASIAKAENYDDIFAKLITATTESNNYLARHIGMSKEIKKAIKRDNTELIQRVKKLQRCVKDYDQAEKQLKWLVLQYNSQVNLNDEY